MALNRYRFNYADIPPEEFQLLFEKIDAWSYNGIFCDWQKKAAEFFLDENKNPDIFNIPAHCHLTRVR